MSGLEVNCRKAAREAPLEACDDEWEDYRAADAGTRERMIKMWGNPQ